jgi:trehalose 6-phosphate synthase
MIGVDRLDYSKGLPERMDGIARFFDRHPERVDDLLYIQIAPPSREDIGSYQKIRAAGTKGRADQRRAQPGRPGARSLCQPGPDAGAAVWLLSCIENRPGHPLARRDEPRGQGICRGAGSGRPGVLILSRFAGAAQQLTDALLVNPYSPDDIASMIGRALDMPLEERKARWRQMHACVKDENVVWIVCRL